MMTRKKQMWLIGLIACLFVFSFSFGLVGALAEDKPVFNGISLEEEYALGTALTVPEGTFTVNGEATDAEAVVVFPNGARYKSSGVTLSQVGNYRIEYSCYVSGAKYTQSVEFCVYNSLYQVNNSIQASAQYYENYEIEEYDGSTSSLSGLLVELPSGAEFRFNDVIDFSDKSKADAFVSFLIVPESLRTADFEILYFQLTDIHDPDNYVRISYQKRGANTIYGLQDAYAKAGAAFQPMVGYEAGLDKIHTNNIYGCPSRTSFCGCPQIDADGNCTALMKNAFTAISFDYSAKELYTTAGSTTSMITDLDSSTFYTDMWSGFTTCEAYLSIYAGEYTGANPAKIFISDINGVDLSDNRLEDKTAPVLQVEFGDVDPDALPSAIVGYSYPVFAATALDSVDGQTEVKVFVYYNYESTNRSLCNIVDGRVEIKRSGLYTMVYESTDGSGNKARQEYIFTAKSPETPLAAQLPDNIEKSVQIGETISLPQVSVSDYVHSYSIEISVANNGIQVPVPDLKFTPKALGNYIVTYTVEDFVGQKTQTSYTLEIVDSGKPVFYETAEFPKYLISGKSYVFPPLDAYDYTTQAEGEAVSVTKYLTDKNGRTQINGDTFTPSVAQSGDNISLEYVAANAQGGETVVPFSRPCYIVGDETGIDLTKYFIINGSMTVTASSAHTTFVTSEEGSGFTFLNALLADQMEFKFNIDADNNAFDAFDVYLTDAENDGIVIKISFIRSGDHAAVRINDSADMFSLESSFENEMLMSVTFNAFVNTITTEYNDSITLYVGTTLHGEQFDGFPSGMVYLSAVFSQVSGSAGVDVRRISGQPITNVTEDSIRPSIGILGVYDAQYALNTTVTLYQALAVDVLDPEVGFTMSVRDPNRQYVKDINTGLELNEVAVGAYTISLSDYGRYTISYRAVDSSGRSMSYTLNLLVFDDQKPEITVEGDIPQTMSVGQTLTLPNASATDNLDGDVDVYILIEDPRGAVRMLVGSSTQNDTWSPAEQGVYVIKYCALDEAGNWTVLNHEIRVS